MQSLIKFTETTEDNKTVTIQQHENGMYIGNIINKGTPESAITTDIVNEIMRFFALHGIEKITWG